MSNWWKRGTVLKKSSLVPCTYTNSSSITMMVEKKKSTSKLKEHENLGTQLWITNISTEKKRRRVMS